MAEKKPIKVDQGKLKEFSSSDDLPNQSELNELKEIVADLVKDLISIGLPLKSERLYKLLK